MNNVKTAARWLFALFYTAVGCSWFSHQLLGTPWPAHQEAPAAKALTVALTESGLVDPLIAAVCLAGGILLFVGRTAPLGIAVLAPLVTGIFLFHLLLNQNWAWGTLNLCFLIALAWLHRGAFRPLWNYGKGCGA
ncbi:MAG: hypothetical protein ABI389_10115 [Rhodanobacter sp.]